MWSHEKAVDGKDVTGWLSRMRRVMQEEYIILDLGGVKVINQIDIKSNRFIGRDLFPPRFQAAGERRYAELDGCCNGAGLYPALVPLRQLDF